MADQLAIWNVALAHLGERRLASLAEPREPTRVLADEWVAAVNGCLSIAPWAFSTKTAAITTTGAGTGTGPYPYGLPKPSDWLRTVDIGVEPTLTQPLTEYLEEGTFWAANIGLIIVRYVSTDPAFGYNVPFWHQPFADYVALALAARCCRRLTGAADMLGDILKLREAAMHDALAYEQETAARQYPLPTGAGETQLQVFNDTLTRLGRPRATSLTNATSAMRALNRFFLEAVRWSLAQAPWSFAARVIGVNATTGANVSVYSGAFPKPADWVLTLDIAADQAFTKPIPNFNDEAGFWYADSNAIAVRYVSADPNFGLNLSNWPEGFRDLVAARLAALVAGVLGAQEQVKALTEDLEAQRSAALDAEAARAARVFGVGAAQQTQLEVYNTALGHLGRPRMASISETNATSRALNDQFATAVRWCLRQGRWAFAARVATLVPNGAVPPAPYTAAFAKPVDWVSTLDVAADAQVTQPITEFADEAGLWYAAAPQIVVRYVSSDPANGRNVTLWTPAFLDLVALRLAELSAGRLGAEAALPGIVEQRNAAMQEAQAVEAADAARRYPGDADLRSQIAVLNDALAYLGRPRMAALTDAGPVMRAMIEAWPHAVRWALEQGPWTFAIRAIMIGPFGDNVPTFGYANAFKKPDDWLQTVLVSEFDDFRAGSTTFADETGWWFADAPGLFVQYLSLGPNYGMNLQRWSPSFVDLVALRIAERIAPQIGAGGLVAGLMALRADAMKRLRATDALNTPPRFAPNGSWVAARRGGNRAGRRWGAGPGGPPIPFTGDTTLSGDSDLPINNDFIPRISG
ncbi:hypothetical protein A3862_27450 [Methylobacterium sp. XJLW]|jgi:hypothetical protein|uniref:hypothetical protein n=1 Tax=Methylobacterium sp. XJLW TaxID=739141 RepID=UPI000DAAE6DA|nr:hypothetical protein [Methylobacterium sp. XJLW]AWV18818.1 hypothetical protein A3862_27450 [Methylobacterium sp. XJLW]